MFNSYPSIYIWTFWWLGRLLSALQDLKFRLDASPIAGTTRFATALIALADLPSLAQRTVLTGTAFWSDIFLLAPGSHKQQLASEANGGEYPTTGAMTTGYVFRVENQAMVYFLQRVGVTGHLVTVHVSPKDTSGRLGGLVLGGGTAALLYVIGILLSVVTIAVLGAVKDYWAASVLLILMFARLLNVVVIRRRAQLGWHGAPEPEVEGDLLVLLSQDRWVRIRGWVDDIKAVTSGQWLRDRTGVEDFATSLATLLVYIAAGLATNASTLGSLCIGSLLVVSVALVGSSNTMARDLVMLGHRVSVSKGPEKYKRRRDLADEMIKIHKRDDWAIAMGLITTPTGTVTREVQV